MFNLSKAELKVLRTLYNSADGIPFSQLNLSDDLYLRLSELKLIKEPNSVIVPEEKLGFPMITHGKKIFITTAGRAELEYHLTEKSWKRFNEIRAWITLGLAIASLILSVVQFFT